MCPPSSYVLDNFFFSAFLSFAWIYYSQPSTFCILACSRLYSSVFSYFFAASCLFGRSLFEACCQSSCFCWFFSFSGEVCLKPSSIVHTFAVFPLFWRTLSYASCRSSSSWLFFFSFGRILSLISRQASSFSFSSPFLTNKSSLCFLQIFHSSGYFSFDRENKSFLHWIFLTE